MPDEVQRLYEAIKPVLTSSIQMLSQQIGTDIHQQNRDFFLVHNRGGLTCKRCANRISELKPDGRVTNFCRACQG
jgi:formamidopyrimidine-DNA glycosylase